MHEQHPPPGHGHRAPGQPPWPGQPGQAIAPYAERPERQVGYFERVRTGGYVPTEYEKEQAFYAHLLAGVASLLFCGMVFPAAAPLLIHALAKEKGPFLLYHVNQAVLFQAAFFAINTGIAMVGGILSIVCIGYFLLLLLPVSALVAAIYPIVVAFGAKSGEWSDYPVLGPKVRLEWRPFIN